MTMKKTDLMDLKLDLKLLSQEYQQRLNMLALFMIKRAYIQDAIKLYKDLFVDSFEFRVIKLKKMESGARFGFWKKSTNIIAITTIILLMMFLGIQLTLGFSRD